MILIIKTTLDLTDDAARVNWGGNWKIPSKNDFDELLENTTATYVVDYLGRGADGILFTSNNNGNTVFFPYDNNTEWAKFKIMACELDNTGCPYVLCSCSWWDDKTPEWDDYEPYREYSYIYRPIFISN